MRYTTILLCLFFIFGHNFSVSAQCEIIEAERDKCYAASFKTNQEIKAKNTELAQLKTEKQDLEERIKEKDTQLLDLKSIESQLDVLKQKKGSLETALRERDEELKKKTKWKTDKKALEQTNETLDKELKASRKNLEKAEERVQELTRKVNSVEKGSDLKEKKINTLEAEKSKQEQQITTKNAEITELQKLLVQKGEEIEQLKNSHSEFNTYKAQELNSIRTETKKLISQGDPRGQQIIATIENLHFRNEKLIKIIEKKHHEELSKLNASLSSFENDVRAIQKAAKAIASAYNVSAISESKTTLAKINNTKNPKVTSVKTEMQKLVNGYKESYCYAYQFFNSYSRVALSESNRGVFKQKILKLHGGGQVNIYDNYLFIRQEIDKLPVGTKFPNPFSNIGCK